MAAIQKKGNSILKKELWDVQHDRFYRLVIYFYRVLENYSDCKNTLHFTPLSYVLTK